MFAPTRCRVGNTAIRRGINGFHCLGVRKVPNFELTPDEIAGPRNVYGVDELAQAFTPDPGLNPIWTGFARTLIIAVRRLAQTAGIRDVGEPTPISGLVQHKLSDTHVSQPVRAPTLCAQ